MVFQADISILYSTRRQTVSELQAGCGHIREHKRSSGSDETSILTGQDKNQQDTPTLAPGLGTDFENESAFCL